MPGLKDRLKRPARRNAPSTFESLPEERIESAGGRAVITVLLIAALVITAIFVSLWVHNVPLSYYSSYGATLIGRTVPYDGAQAENVTVSIWLTTDGPFSRAHEVELYQVVVGGDRWTPGTNASVLIAGALGSGGIGLAFDGSWRVNASEQEYGSGQWTFTVNHAGSYNATVEGLVDFGASVTLWQGTARLGFASLQPLAAPPSLLVQPPQAWAQYDGLRITTTVAVATLIFAGIPSGFKTIRDLAWPTLAKSWALQRRPKD